MAWETAIQRLGLGPAIVISGEPESGDSHKDDELGADFGDQRPKGQSGEPDLQRALFEEAAQLPKDRREAFLEGLDDPYVAENLRELLRVAESGSFLGGDAVAASGPIVGPFDHGEIESMIGPYRILREIGRGGMGVVYEAAQSAPRRTVAVKLLHGQVGPRERRRFEQEAQALAMLDDSAIVSLFEAGVAADGRQYLVMERVRGISLTEYATTHRLSFEQRVVLFQEVCRAVSYAHGEGVLHRDIKPSNILVDQRDSGSLVGSLPRVRILDFGLARILTPGTALPPITEYGRPVGTLEYMSPEALGDDPDGISESSDVYSLGVVFYELLTGHKPIEPDARWIVDAAQRIKNDVPRRPSRWEARAKGDLDTVILKALAKEPSRRYASVAAFSVDVTRVMERRPIEARPPSAAYRLTRFAHRRRAYLVGLFSVTVIALSATWGTTNGIGTDALLR